MTIRRISILFPVIILVAFGRSGGAHAAIFNVTNPAEFQSALTTAEGNGENDTINVAAGLYSMSGITYQLNAGDDNNTLLVQGADATTTILDFGGFNNFNIWTTGLATDSNAHVTLRGVTIQNGNGCGGGGLEMNSDLSNLVLENCFVINNTSCDGDGGGANINSNRGMVSIINCVFSGNAHGVSGDDGGGAYLQTSSGRVVVTNCTFTDNATDGGTGDGLAIWLLEDTAVADLYNNIIRGNGTEDIYVNDDGFFNQTGAPTNVFNNDYGSFTILDGDNLSLGNNINLDPLLTADYHLQAGSPAIDAGANAAPSLPATDIDGEARIMNGIVDMGVDEFPGPVQEENAIPTLNVWSLMLLILLGAVLGVIGIRKGFGAS